MTKTIHNETLPQPATVTSHAVRHTWFRLTLSSEIRIAASPKRIWEILTDFAAYERLGTVPFPARKGKRPPEPCFRY